MARETMRNAIEQLAANRRVLETRIRQIDQSIILLQSMAERTDRSARHVAPLAHRVGEMSGWQR